MKSPNVSPQQIAQIASVVAGYIETQRAKYRPQSLPMWDQQKQAMSGYFSPEVLDGTHLLLLVDERIPNPDFYLMLSELGFKNLPDQSAMAAITYFDVVVSHVPYSDGLLFHELVHVEQYRQLGTRRFAELYVRGFLRGGSYDAIPLEVNAYTLERRFSTNLGQPFSVADVVKEWILGDEF